MYAESVETSPGSQCRRRVKDTMHHLKLFDKRYSLANRLSSDN